MMLYLESNTTPYIYFDVHLCDRFTHNSKVSHETYFKRMCQYLQGNKYKGLVFNPFKKMMIDCYADAYFAGL